tara:strand:- start:2838 stop:3479 length:642 start_codon:yes stop_codon:yes gene_type:complete
MLAEERKTIIKKSGLSEYLAYCRSNVWPSIRTAGGQILCVVGGVIGKPKTHLVQITSFNNFDDLKTSQGAWAVDRSEFIEHEAVSLLQSISTRPKEIIPPEDRRPFYGLRKFYISSSNVKEFVECSEDGIWPRMEKMGASIIGMWTTLSSTTPTEITLLTGYNSPTHWEQTRFDSIKSNESQDQIWDREEALRNRRNDITLNTYVDFMESVEF